MRALVCGHRDFWDKTLMNEVLSLHNITEVIEGEARGADTLARLWAEARNIPVKKFPADWKTFGRAAGPIRNAQMITEGKPDIVIAFLAKDSKGTANMIRQAKNANIQTVVVEI